MEGELSNVEGSFLQLGPYIERQATIMCEPVKADRQVALTYYLADEGHMRKIANSFGLSRSFVSIIIRKVCRAIYIPTNLRKKIP